MLSLLYKQMRYFKIDALKRYLLCLVISYLDDIITQSYYDICQLANIIK